jgi:hypothetical protein
MVVLGIGVAGYAEEKRDATSRVGRRIATFALPDAGGKLVGVARDAVVLAFHPHMHLRGKDFEYQAIYPDGRKETLLSVPQYDFNWQHIYRLKEPLKIPKGSTIRCVAHYDNSAANPANPDPKREVRWGDQTWDEMMIGYLDFYWADGK